MNIQNRDLLIALAQAPFVSQRDLAERTGFSLGLVNKCLRSLTAAGYLTEDCRLTEASRAMLQTAAPKNAILLAAGLGMRMVPINMLTPKAFLEVRGEALIERLIRQLQEAGIRDITVVVGFMKERFDYLIDEYGVRLAVNAAYTEKNNLTSLAMVADRISNTYILPCDLWFAENPFRRQELYSWYMVTDRKQGVSDVRVNRKQELIEVDRDTDGNAMVGLSYFLEQDAAPLRSRLTAMAKQTQHNGSFWEAALYKNGKMMIPARVISGELVTEINTYEQLRELNTGADRLQPEARQVIASVLSCGTEDITEVSVLKKGMTNRSFRFRVGDSRYLMRIPCEGSERLISRSREAAVFRAISGRGLCDDPVYMDPVSGNKITRYLEGARVCDPEQEEDLRRCMGLLKRFHAMDLQVDHSFDLFGQIDFYERLWGGKPSAYRDYAKTKQQVLSLRAFLDRQPKRRCLTHIDAVPDNFLFYRPAGETEERLQLIDWEYAGMQDPHLDVAMFCVYSMFDKPRTDRLIDLYFADEVGCDTATRAKIYCYAAASGLLWSNWCEYERNLGVEFGAYSLCQYRCAKDYCRYAAELIQKIGENTNES